MKYFVLLTLAIFFSNCSKDEDDNILNVTIENQTNSEITDIKLYVNIGVTNYNFTDSLLMGNIGPNDSFSKNWDLNNLSSTDGDFVIYYQSNSEIKEKEFGYFSNGNLIEKEHHIKIGADTVIVTKSGN